MKATERFLTKILSPAFHPEVVGRLQIYLSFVSFQDSQIALHSQNSKTWIDGFEKLNEFLDIK